MIPDIDVFDYIRTRNWTNHRLLEPPSSFLSAGANLEDADSDDPWWLLLLKRFIEWLFQWLQRRRHEVPSATVH